MISKKDLEVLAQTRLVDAFALHTASRFSAAYYLAGYAVELGIKAVIASMFRSDAIPDRDLVNKTYSHKLDHLIGVAGLKDVLERDMTADPSLQGAWGVATKWSEASRYEIKDQFAARSILDAVGSDEYGVLRWLKKHW